MKKDIHPDYKPVIFHDVTCNKSFLLSSTIKTNETMKYEDGNEYPVYKIETSSESHPFYTCLLYTSPSPRDATLSRMPSSA